MLRRSVRTATLLPNVAKRGTIARMNRPTNIRFGVLGFAYTLSLLTYLDRICLMRVKPEIQRDLGFDDPQMGLVFASFAVGYALFEVPGGRLGDRFGPRIVLPAIVVFWSLFTAWTGLIWATEVSLALALMLSVRFLFGVGEAGAYPNLNRVTATWFPYRERALAQGAVWMAARLGGAMAPFVIGRLMGLAGWRMAFVLLGLIGLVWAAAFAWWYRNTPEEMPACNDAERAVIREGPHSFQGGQAHGPVPWLLMLSRPSVWCLCLVSACVSFSWYFFPTWQPLYLKEAHGIQYQDSELLTGLPFLFGAFGSLIGGGLSDRLIRTTGSRRWGRSLVGAVAFTGAGICAWATGQVSAAWSAVALLCLTFFINDLGIPPIWAACSDIGGKHAGALSGLMNMSGGFGAVLGPALTPILRQSLAWWQIFVLMALLWFVAAIAWLGVNAAKPLEPDHS